MKRVLISFGIGTTFVILYLAVGAVIILIATNGMKDTSHLPTVDHAMRLPKMIYYYFSPPTAEDYAVTVSAKKALLAGFFLLANVVIYSGVAYMFLSIIGRLRKPRAVEAQASPPPPPASLD